MTGCLRRMEFIFEQSVIIIASGAISVAFVQVSFCIDYISGGICINFVLCYDTKWNSLHCIHAQILGVISAFMLAKTIRRTKSLRETRRWQMHQSLGIVPGNDEKPSYEDYCQLEKSGARL